MYQDRNRDRGGYNRRPKPQYDRRPAYNRPAPIPEGFALYYIAAPCPEEIDTHIHLFKDYMQQKYGSRAAQKSPAHLTIVPPFKAEEDLQGQLIDFVTTYNMGLVPFELELKNFGHFSNRVIFVDVVPNPLLNTLEEEVNHQFKETFPGIIFRTQPEFNPHVTIATRDIPEDRFDEAWSYFEHQQFNMGFTCNALALYKLVNGKWNAI
jgi:2'-5' RNA ligase